MKAFNLPAFPAPYCKQPNPHDHTGPRRRRTWTGLGQAVLTWLAMMALLPVTVHGQAPNPTIVYGASQNDFQWLSHPTIAGAYYAPVPTLENYSQEVWERPIKDKEYNVSTIAGETVWVTKDLYYGFIDLVSAAYAFDDNFFYLSMQVAGGFSQKPGSSADFGDGLKGQYLYYFGNDQLRFVLEVDNATGLTTSWATGRADWYRDAGGDSAYGSAISTTYDDNVNEKNFTSFTQELAQGHVYARAFAGAGQVEMAVRLSALAAQGWSVDDFYNTTFSIVGAALSNPSSVNDLFVNDNFSHTPGSGVEYDTMWLGIQQTGNGNGGHIIPEPGRMTLLLAAGLMHLWHRRRPTTA